MSGSTLAFTPKMPDIIAWFKYILRTNTDIRDWCIAHQGKQPRLFFGVDMTAPPKEVDMPFIVLERDKHIGGPTSPTDIYTIVIAAYILREGVTTEGDVVTASGVDEIEELLYLIRDKIELGLPSEIYIGECELFHCDVDEAPVYRGQIEFSIYCQRCMGGFVTIDPPPTT
jgi:hypothetical protein